MDAKQQELLKRQEIIAEGIRKIGVNFGKDGPDRKNNTYIKVRLDNLKAHWNEFEMNHGILQDAENQTNNYYTAQVYEKVKGEYLTILQKLQTWPSYTAGDKDSETFGHTGETSKNVGVLSKADELKTQQATNFRAFSRLTRNMIMAELTEKWDIEDKLKTLEARWKVIDEVHWKLDNILVGSDVNYELEFSKYEATYESTKRDLNRKLNLAAQQRDSAPKIEIPVFSGNYSQWPTFLDLYAAAIHNNPTFSKAQKMQHLKGKLKGEAERLVQHLSVSESSYDSCWELLNHRYNNRQLLFTKQMQTLMGQSTIQHQNAYELKRLHDTSLEVVHALRNLGIDTTTWDPILVHILGGKLDSQTYSDYMEARKHPRELPVFEELIQFVENKFTALETITKKKNPPNFHKQASSSQDKESTSFQRDAYKYKRAPKANHTSSNKNCPICKTDHLLVNCSTFQEMNPELKLRTLEQLNVCKNCMYSHRENKCNSNKRCRVCNNTHHTTLHDIFRDTAQMNLSNGQRPNNKPSSSLGKANHVSGNFNEVLLSTVMLRVKAIDGTYTTLRCLLDQGSQLNLITESAVQQLGLRRYNQNSTVSGIGAAASHSNGTVYLECESLYGDYQFTTQALVMAKLLNNLPNYSFEKQDWPHIQNINLADPHFNLSRPVDILLDAGIYADIIMNNILRGNINTPVAQQTRLGWILVGNTKTFNCHVVVNTEDISRFWEMEEITAQNDSLTVEEDYCEALYTQTTKRLEDGRYAVRIPMKENFDQHLGQSKPQAIAIFKQLEKRFARDENLASSYKAFINEYIALEHMRPCTMPTTPSCFLPHHGVLRPDSTTTKLRVVFNASATTTTGRSLNQLMECGPNLQQDIQAMILRWRAFQYVYTADIEKFYRQIRIQEADQHLQKIVWRNSVTEPLQEFQLTTVTYGTKSAPFLAMRTIKQLIKDDGAEFPLAVNMLSNQLYVDDLLGGGNDIVTAEKAQQELISMLKRGGFNLRKWTSNNKRLLENLPTDLVSQEMFDFKNIDTNKTLGITWNPRTDQFTYKRIPLIDKRDVNTKRTLLSDISKLYDPLGWLSPVTLRAKLIFQQAWNTTAGWDDCLPLNIQQEWEQFRQQMVYIHDISIPRWMCNTELPFEIYGFCDSSERAYGCVVYCKSTDKEGQPLIRLVAAKTKLAPLKKPISLPRLELCGAALLAQLVKKVAESFNTQQKVTTYCWTDSMVVLGWLQGDVKRWKSFVANRVSKITQIIPTNAWRHVKSQENPADCASRGILPADLMNHKLWWNGPAWLQNNNIIHKQETFATNEELRNREQSCATQTSQIPLIETLLQKHSSMARVTRIVSWILRFTNNSRDATKAKRISQLTTEDLELAEYTIIKIVQNNSFGDDITHIQKYKKVRATSKLLNLCPILDNQGILRVGGRLEHASLTSSQKHPIILPNNHKLSNLLIERAHKQTLHGGARLTLGHLRNKYWIIGGMKTIKKQLNKCITCHRYKTQRSIQLMADLPPARVTPSRPFTHTGVDFTGHVDIKANKGRGIKTVKAYVAIFVCLSSKATHLELVSDLSTSTFLAALKRLCARRGTPKHVYSDNGTNFVGAARVLAKERQEALQLINNSDLIKDISEYGIEWHFNAPSWPTAGGLWEAAVKSMKHHLKRVIGEQKLTYEEFNTVLTQIEACLNSRPLVALTNDPDDLDYLTPGHFLVGGPVLAPPMTSEFDNTSLTIRWRLTQNMYKEFWKRWSQDYLQTLQVRGKWQTPTQNIAVGDVVLIKEDQIPPARWLLGRVTETHPGADNLVRVVTLKTKSNIMKRPITKVSRLPIETGRHIEDKPIEEPDSIQKEATSATPSRQARQRPTTAKTGIYTTCLTTMLMFMIMCVAPSSQQLVNVTTLDPSRLVFFDKTADIQIIQDEWRLVIYYNMSTYWKSVSAVEQYVKQLQELDQRNTAYFAISTQFEHELNELRHYHEVLKYEHGKRLRRGLINGIGNIANSLFGVLDDKFAEKYSKDIKLIQSNEDHLINLYKNQTSVIEGEYNLLKRNEQVMNRQFIVINKQLRDCMQQLKTEQDKAAFIIATAVAANMMVDNLRRIQNTLIDLITDIHNGKVDTHLLKPDAFEKQLNIISGQVPKGLSLPCTSGFKCIRKLYKLSSVHGKLIKDFLIFEVTIPLVTDEQYELTQVIPISNINGSSMVSIIPTAKYMAVNLRKDMMIPLHEQQILSCIQIKTSQLLCNFDLPIYEIKTTTGICEADIINNRVASSCRTRISSCTNDWIKLHSKNAWLFRCCEECTMRIFCPAGITSQTLHNTGTIALATGCMMRGDNHLIHAHYNLQSKMELDEDDEIYIPETSINHVVSSNSNLAYLTNTTIETHEEQLNDLKKKIMVIKDQQDIQIIKSIDAEQHHYVLYGFITVCGTLFGIWIFFKVRNRFSCLPQAQNRKEEIEMVETHESSRPARAREEATEETTGHLRACQGNIKMDCGTSPMSVRAEPRTS